MPGESRAERYPILLSCSPLGLNLLLDLVFFGLLLGYALLLQLHQLHLPHPLLLMLCLRSLPRQLILIPASTSFCLTPINLSSGVSQHAHTLDRYERCLVQWKVQMQL